MKTSFEYLKGLATTGLIVLAFSTEAQTTNTADKNKVIGQIYQVEKSFQDDLNNIGVAYAFSHYAADSATIKRGNDSLIHTKEEIKRFYSSENYKKAKAYWKPDFVDVSNDGTMAYTYGRYSWNFMEGDKIIKTFSGVFHTVWKKLTNGEWRYVWD
jgi:hypothetical protein